MKVKVADKVYDCRVEPVMLILDEEDKENIIGMIDKSTKYCFFPPLMSKEERESFMEIKENLYFTE